MPISVKAIMPCLWFDTQAEEAASHYVSIFPKSKLGKITRYGHEGKEIHGKPPGSVLTVEFELEGIKFLALNGGPLFKFDEAVSFQVLCETQADIDYFWSKLVARRVGKPVRLAEGQVRPVLAGGSDHPERDAAGPGCRDGPTAPCGHSCRCTNSTSPP